MTEDDRKPTTETDRPNISTEHQRAGDARRPGDTLDKEQIDQHEIERRTRLLGDE